MSPINIFFACSCAILTLAILNMNLSPCINHSVKDWSSINIQQMSDYLEDIKSKATYQVIELYKKVITMFRNLKATYEMEYTIFTINLGIGVICVILGLYNIQKETIPKTGLIGIALGGIGFILTFIYVILNGITFTNYFDLKNLEDIENAISKIDEDGAFAVLMGDDKYKCLYYDGDYNIFSYFAKFSDLMKGRYNYDKEMADSFSESNPEKQQCNNLNYSPQNCFEKGIFEASAYYWDNNNERQRCNKLYYYKSKSDFNNYDKSARILSVFMLSLFTLLCYGGLAFSGFMLFKEAPK